MLTSLFGDLAAAKQKRARALDADEGSDSGFAATAIMESTATEVNQRGQMVDRHLKDLVVTGSAAQAIREHFAATRADLDTASSMITLLDPVGAWASAVIKALSDAGGRPIERLHLRENDTLRTLAVIERTTLVRRHEDTLRVFHADVRSPAIENADIPVALMERSQMTVVIVGMMQTHAVDAMLAHLSNATRLPTWQCPNLLFQLPPNVPWIVEKVNAVHWPARLDVHVLSEPMTGASSVWNAMLGRWNQVRLQPGWHVNTVSPMLGTNDFPIKVGELTHPTSPTPSKAMTVDGATPTTVAQGSRGAVNPTRGRLALSGMTRLDGLLGCALVDANSGLVLAREVREDEAIDIELASATCAQLLRGQRAVASQLGLPDPIDELITSAGARHLVMRMLPRHPELFLMALLDKQRTNLALARFQLMEVERGLL